MITIRDLINKIKWDDNLNQLDYKLFYLDRIKNSLIKIEYDAIQEISHNFMEIINTGELVEIPLHRIKKVTCKDKIIWSR